MNTAQKDTKVGAGLIEKRRFGEGIGEMRKNNGRDMIKVYYMCE